MKSNKKKRKRKVKNMKNKLFKKGIALLTAACTLVAASSFGNITAKANDATAVKLEESLTIENTDDAKVFKFNTDNTDSYYKVSLKGIDGELHVAFRVFEDAECTEEVEKTFMTVGPRESSVNDLHKLLKPNSTYYAQITGFSYSGSLDLKVKLEKYDTDDHPDDREALTEVKVGAEQTGILNHSTDEDYYAFVTGKDDAFYNMQIKAVGNSGLINGMIYSDPEMTEPVHDFYVENGKKADIELHKLLKPNTRYYVMFGGEVDAYSSLKYTFSFVPTKDDAPDTVNEAKTLELNKSYKQNIQDSEDVDFFKITASVYTNYTVIFKNTSDRNDILLDVYKDADAVERIAGYRVGRKSSVSGDNAKLVLTPGKTYYFRVEGDASYTIGLNATSPNGTKVKKSKSKVTISWKKLTKAQGYEVYRATGTSNKFKCIKKIKSAKTVKYVDKTVKKRKTYKYKVRAFAKKGGKTFYSSFSPVKTIKVK